jgi:DNA-binding transcriptional LysR family regulator
MSDMTDLFDEIPTFVAVVEAGGFAAAARHLNLSRSAVGKAVARLEARLGAQLLQRTTRHVALTEDGHAFYEHCQRALAELRAGRFLLDQGRRDVGGVLRVSMPVLYGRLRVAPVLARLALEHQSLALELDFRDGLIDLTRDKFDLAVRMGPLHDIAGLIAVRIGEERTLLCASPSYLERHGHPEHPDRLEGHVAITYARDGRTQPWSFPRAGEPPLVARPQSRFRLDDLGAIMDASLAGIGLAWLPDWLVDDALRRGALLPVLPLMPPAIGPIHAVWPAAGYPPLRVRAAIDALKRVAAARDPSAADANAPNSGTDRSIRGL